ncbi:MAG: hypothetical protein UU15_C0001G0030 [Candidatus Levybacteria bacterium GW2011_GWC2_40_7]|nr:MAG: hypothetical protein UU15_C0001G0030 [Candidatus Levybacteria bacterium GW2011_GWC2_40_7]
MNYKTTTVTLLVILGVVFGSLGTYFFLNREQGGTSLTPTPSTKDQVQTPSPTEAATESSEDIIKELTPVLDPDNNPNFFATVEVREGNYAQGTASFGGGGYGWDAVKQNGKWEVILKTQNEPPCSTMEQYGFPESVYKTCH